jgi:hypothetical protein
MMGGSQGKILGWAEAAELAKIVVEVRLIEIAARQRDIDPIDIVCAFDGRDDFLESLHAAEKLRREADLVPEQLNEMTLAETHAFGHCCA